MILENIVKTEKKYSAIIVSDEKKASSYLKQLSEEFDVIITDVKNVLHELDKKTINVVIIDDPVNANGIKLIEEIKSKSYDTSVIFVNAPKDPEYTVKAFRKGVSNYLFRKFKNKELIDSIKKSVKRSVEEQEDDLFYGLLGEKFNKDNLVNRIQDEIYFTLKGEGGRLVEHVSKEEALRRVLSKKILVVEHDESERMRLVDMLKKQYNVVCASSMKDALSILPGEVDAVITNLVLGEEFEGPGLVYQIKEKYKNIHILTTNNVSDLSEFVISHGAFPVYKLDELQDILRGILEKERKVPDFKNHLYLIMGPTGAGKSEITKRINQSLRDIAVCKRYTTRPKRENETDEEHIFINQKSFNTLKNKRFIFTYPFGDYEVGIPYSINYNFEEGKDVVLILTDYRQLSTVREIYEKMSISNKLKIVPIMIYAHTSDLEKRILERDKNVLEVQKRIDLVEKQAAEYKEHSKDFKYIVINDSPFYTNEELKDDAKLIELSKIVQKVVSIIERERIKNGRDISYEQYHREYVDEIVNGLFGMNFEQLDEKIRKNEEVKLDFSQEFSENYAKDEKIPSEFVERSHLRNVLDVGNAYGRAMIVFEYVEEQNLAYSKRDIFLDLIERKVGAAWERNKDNRPLAFSLYGQNHIYGHINDGLYYSLTDDLFLRSLNAEPYSLVISFAEKSNEKIIGEPSSFEEIENKRKFITDALTNTKIALTKVPDIK